MCKSKASFTYIVTKNYKIKMTRVAARITCFLHYFPLVQNPPYLASLQVEVAGSQTRFKTPSLQHWSSSGVHRPCVQHFLSATAPPL